MGTMTLADFRDELVVGLGNRVETGFTTTRQDRYINFAYRHMTRPAVFRHPEVVDRYDISLVTSTDEYTLSVANVGRRVLGIKDATYYANATVSSASTVTRRDLKPRSLHWMNKRSKASGAPGYFTLEGVSGVRTFIIDSLPSSTENGYQVRLYYWGEVDLLSDTTDTTILEDYWDHVLVAGSIFWAKWFLGYKDEAVVDGQMYAQLINEAVPDVELGIEDTGYQIEVENEPYMETTSS